MPRLRYDPARDYYALLDVDPTASGPVIQRAYRERAKTCHPDHNPGREAWATATFQQISEAYRVLSDPALRREYDNARWPYARQNTARTYHDDRARQERVHHYYTRYTASYPPPHPRPPARRPGQGLITLVRGPFGSIYILLLLFCLMMPVSTLFVDRWTGLANELIREEAAAESLVVDPACPDPAVQITFPRGTAIINAIFDVYGTAAASDLAEYRLLIRRVEGTPDAPGRWQFAGPARDRAVEDGLLMAEASLPSDAPGLYALRLEATLQDGTALPTCERRVLFLGNRAWAAE